MVHYNKITENVTMDKSFPVTSYTQLRLYLLSHHVNHITREIDALLFI